MIKSFLTFCIAILLCISMIACKGLDIIGLVDSGKLSISLTDAPIDNATQVMIKFNAVEVKPKEGSSVIYQFDEPKVIDLLALQNGQTELLLKKRSINDGDYSWLRLVIDADYAALDSYITFDDGSSHSLYIPSGDEPGLKLNHPFTITAGENTNLTIDFDLRKSILKPSNTLQDYKLKPVLRIHDNAEVGTIKGHIEGYVVADESCQTGLAVYVYTASDDGTNLGDEGSNWPPISSSIPEYDATNDRFNYQLSFLPSGNYIVAVTCDADNDDPENDETESEWAILVSKSANVMAEKTTNLNFD
ncbi:DUF4382 domain-containing protein [Aliikangiella sp. IMCC44359]|uniref:DUF4382 domain-containing protein n=1 Tax=Aliikangiella sp. IMCC44359 TaxID=3459125 RepID=UPI00403AA80C